MKHANIFRAISVFLLLFQCGLWVARADTITLESGHTIDGTAIQTNGDQVLILTSYSAYNLTDSSIKAINAGPIHADDASDAPRLPDFQKAVLFLSQQPWATNLTPIPATVIDKGILKNVPYVSFHCGADYEVNVYGDLDHPAGIEIGVYHKMIGNSFAELNCLNFICSLLGQSADQEVLQGLNLKKDLKTREDLTFEITPPTADDAYNGWWVSVYSEPLLNSARASDDDMKRISVSKESAVEQSPQAESPSWSADELKQARAPLPAVFTFTDDSGDVITNAEVVRVFVKGVSVIWKAGSRLGMARLSNLPDDVQTRFGYDEAKTKAADELAQEQKKEQQEEAQAAVQAAQAAAAQPDSNLYGDSSYSGGGYSGGGSVYVHGYYRSNGTYVNSYTRSSPHSR